MASLSSDNDAALLAAAQRLRDARTACRRFLMLWAMSPANENWAQPREDLTLAPPTDDPEALLRAISNPQNPDWSVLYRGGLLDD